MSRFFNSTNYYVHLATKNLGRPCAYFETLESTIDIASKAATNTLVVAKEQTKGRGQRTNVWHSPAGCAMGSIRLNCPKSSMMAKRICFMQHIMALSAAWAMGDLDKKLGQENVRLKWPNDIIYKDPETGEKLKIGGVLVHTTEESGGYDVILSFGLNVFNEEPTTCISKIIGETNTPSIEVVVAKMMNHLEKYTYDLTEQKFEEVKEAYKTRCVQLNTTVKDEFHGDVSVADVDDDGYLKGTNSKQESCTVTKIVN